MAKQASKTNKTDKRTAARKAATARASKPEAAAKQAKPAAAKRVVAGDRARAADAVAFDVRTCKASLESWFAYTDGGNATAYVALLAYLPNPTGMVAGFAIGASEPTEHARIEALGVVLGRYTGGPCCVTPCEAALVLEAADAVPAEHRGYGYVRRIATELSDTIANGRSKAVNAVPSRKTVWVARYDWQHKPSSKRWVAMQAAAAARVAS